MSLMVFLCLCGISAFALGVMGSFFKYKFRIGYASIVVGALAGFTLNALFSHLDAKVGLPGAMFWGVIVVSCMWLCARFVGFMIFDVRSYNGRSHGDV